MPLPVTSQSKVFSVGTCEIDEKDISETNASKLFMILIKWNEWTSDSETLIAKNKPGVDTPGNYKTKTNCYETIFILLVIKHPFVIMVI